MLVLECSANRRGPFIRTVIGICFALALCAACSKAPQPSATNTADAGVQLQPGLSQFVKVQPVQIDPHGAVVTTTGHVNYDEDHVTRLAVPVSGRIVKVLTRLGD